MLKKSCAESSRCQNSSESIHQRRRRSSAFCPAEFELADKRTPQSPVHHRGQPVTDRSQAGGCGGSRRRTICSTFKRILGIDGLPPKHVPSRDSNRCDEYGSGGRSIPCSRIQVRGEDRPAQCPLKSELCLVVVDNGCQIGPAGIFQSTY